MRTAITFFVGALVYAAVLYLLSKFGPVRLRKKDENEDD
jgi:hypothetical protein